MWKRAVVLMLAIGCGDNKRGADPDASIVVIDAGVDGGGDPNFFGEACTAVAVPTLTTCHTDRGWCIGAPDAGGAGTCRPQCDEGSPECGPPGVMHLTLTGACYCAPT